VGGDLGLRSFRQRRLGFRALGLTGPSLCGRREKRCKNQSQDGTPRPQQPAARAGASFSTAFR
jgi:hypothetical protein